MEIATETRLTRRQQEVLLLVRAGLSNKEIGRRLKISHRTVEIHKAQLLEKCGAVSVAELLNRDNASVLAQLEQLDDFYQNAPCGFHSVAPDGTYLRINDTELQWLGMERQDVVGKKKVCDFYTPAGLATFQQRFADFIVDGRMDGVEYDLIGNRGALRRVLVSANATKDAAGQFLEGRCVLHDITEMNLLQEELHRLIREQQMILDNELVGVMKVEGRRISWCNPMLEQMFGYDVGALHETSVRRLYLDDDALECDEEIAKVALDKHGSFQNELEMQKGDGTRIWVQINRSRLPDGEPGNLWVLIDWTIRKAKEDLIEWQANHDHLTSLPNRVLLKDRFEQAAARVARSHQSFALCYLDLDGFKRVNDQFGHNMGDQLLIEVARRLEASLRGNDTACRLGGDEFAVLVTDFDDLSECKVVLQRIVDSIGLPITLAPGAEAHVGVSIGATLFRVDSGSLDLLLQHADLAMYQSKRLGGNMISFYADLPQKSSG